MTNEDKNVRDHDHITGKYRGTAHSDCNINLILTKKVFLIFYNLRCYDSHLIIPELGTFDLKMSVIPNRLETYMAFTITKNVVFIDSMQYMNSGLDVLAKNLRDMNMMIYECEYMDSFEKLSEDKLPDRREFYNSVKDGSVNEKDGSISEKIRQIGEEDYSHATKVWNTSKRKTMGDYHDNYLKREVLILALCFSKN